MHKPTLTSVLRTRYGVTEVTADKITLSWGAMHLAEKVGVAEAARALVLANRKRERLGRIPYYPDYGDPMFEAYYEAARAARGGSR